MACRRWLDTVGVERHVSSVVELVAMPGDHAPARTMRFFRVLLVELVDVKVDCVDVKGISCFDGGPG